ncbi:S41 family peptidase [uncultured Tenacibaculum sp.]|uniref:S41 family peptidase n=1 Tax=uncultured Tenacibaculum sp. TaxID=174713 RepID=UPI00260728EE|nr:S41 family peptidase [uncultured Tenacibaculum sp.]
MKKSIVLNLLLITFIISGCSKTEPNQINNGVNSFIWNGLNKFYLWQEKIPDLSDRKFSTDQQKNNYLATYNNPDNLFESLLYQRNIVDKWSWIVSDYVALEQSFQGTTETTGMEFGLKRFKTNSSNVFGYVRYVVPGTDAANKGVKRGMIFTKVNGTAITDKNYRDLLFSKSNSYTIHLANYNSGDPITNSTTYSLSKSSFTENPIHIAKTIDEGGKKIGYLMYNSFTANFDSKLNLAFSKFKTDGVKDLIIDLRYNGGGSVRTATRLASMITGQFTGDIFAKQLWNKKYMSIVSPDALIDRFPDKIGNSEIINSLNLTNIYFITTGSSASASELIINGLLPHINVKTVGTKTHGKYVGSVTLYDSPNFTKSGVNQNHNWAMQPIVLEIVNKNNYNDKDGIDPTINLPESYGNMGVLGDKNEPLLARTIELITTGKRGSVYNKTIIELESIGNSKSNNPNYNNMYVDLK